MVLKIKQAKDFAADAHRGQKRKISGDPYFSHLENVAQTLRNCGFSSSVVAAGYLHDVLEDTEVTEFQLVRLFGNGITQLVLANSENKALGWEDRKADTIKKASTASLEIKALIAADKLDNSNDLIKHYQHQGDQIWSYFNRGYQKQAVYYQQLVSSLYYGLDATEVPRYFADLKKNVEELFPI